MGYAGNENAAQDLYGVGVRIGLYLQALGMMLSNHAEATERGKALKMASGTITISILASWFVFAARAQFSPSEAICVLLILTSLLSPASATFLRPTTIVGEMPGLLAFVLTDLGISAGLLWTFGRLVSTLPTLNTNNLVFFFAPVRLDGWFRYLALFFCIVDAITSLHLLVNVIKIMRVPWECYLAGESEASKAQLDYIEKTIDWKGSTKVLQSLPWILFSLVVAAIEVTLYWNNLAGSTDFQSSGQLIPLITGILAFVDGLATALRRLYPQAIKKKVAVQKIACMGSITTLPARLRKILSKPPLSRGSVTPLSTLPGTHTEVV